jgi:DNA-binding MarR family transcriptional regulator
VNRGSRTGDRRVTLLALTDEGRRTRDSLEAEMVKSSP